MPPPLPTSLSPHVVVQPSSDLVNLLSSSSLPPLHELLECFSPLSQISTRTVGLAQVPHNNFHLRFSDLADLEHSCREDEDRRAGRTIDWIGGRVARQAASWLVDPKSHDAEPWWDEIKACVEGDRTPIRGEGWNHPVALILATSTLAPNPLQAITALHSRIPEFPPWVDSPILRYTLIVHPTPSNLNPDEAIALLNAVKKQFGLNTHLLQLPFMPAMAPLEIPRPLPQLPPLSTNRASESPQETRTKLTTAIMMSDVDSQNTSRFVREFVTMSLIPSMERCVIEWNETYSSNRRLPSRLFQSTARRLFGSSSQPASSYATAPTNASASSPTSPSTNGGPSSFPPSQHRRLAEFATILGDYKLAVSVWDSLRKDSKPGVDMLPLLLAPSTATLASHAAAALAPLGLTERDVPASAQVRAMVYAVRWEIGVQSFGRLGGERWLAWAAGFAEEPSSALLLGRAASISLQKGASRRAALWFVSAARRLEKSGIKPLTIHFLEKAKEAYVYSTQKDRMFSPSFDDIERSPGLAVGDDRSGFDGIVPYIDHSLGRLKYSNGDTADAVRVFSTLLKGTGNLGDLIESDRMYLEDFRVAFQHLLATTPDKTLINDITLPVKFCRPSETRVRFGDEIDGGVGSGLEDVWREFWASKGKEGLDPGGKGHVGDAFTVELTLFNPLETEVALSDLTVEVEDVHNPAGPYNESASQLADIEVLERVTLLPRQTRTVYVTVIPQKPTTLQFTFAKYTFLSLLPTRESLAVRGKRLNDTPLQRQGITYAPDSYTRLDVQEGVGKLEVRFDGGGSMNVYDEGEGEMKVYGGEVKEESIRITNAGKTGVDEVWVVLPRDGSIWIDIQGVNEDSGTSPIASSSTSIITTETLDPPKPIRIPLNKIHSSASLEPGESCTFPIILCATGAGSVLVELFFAFRENEASTSFHCARARWKLFIDSLISVRTSVYPNVLGSKPYIVGIEVENVGLHDDVDVVRIDSVSPTWVVSSTEPGSTTRLHSIASQQIARTFVDVDRVPGSEASQSLEYLASRLTDVLEGRNVRGHTPPPTEFVFGYLANEEPTELSPSQRHFIRASRRLHLGASLLSQFPYIPPSDLSSIFPLYTPHDVSLVFSWSIPSLQRHGQVTISDLVLGIRHGALRDVLARAGEAKAVRSMYAETTRQKAAMLEAVRTAEWNKDEDPVQVGFTTPERLRHGFTKGPCVIPVSYALRNYSATYAVGFTFTLQRPDTTLYLVPEYVGSLKRHGVIKPLSTVTVHGRAWATTPGMYDASGWTLRVHVQDEQGVKRSSFDQVGGDSLGHLVEVSVE